MKDLPYYIILLFSKQCINESMAMLKIRYNVVAFKAVSKGLGAKASLHSDVLLL